MTANTISPRQYGMQGLPNYFVSSQIHEETLPGGLTSKTPAWSRKGAPAEKLLDFIPAAMVWLSDQQNGGSSDDIPTHRHVCGQRVHVSHSDYSSFFHS